MKWTYSDGKVFLVGSLLMQDVFGLEDGLENVGFTVLVSLTVSLLCTSGMKLVTYVGTCRINRRQLVEGSRRRDMISESMDRETTWDSPTPTLILFLLVSFLKLSVTPTHQQDSFVKSEDLRLAYREWDPGDYKVSSNQSRAERDIPLRNLLPEVGDA